MKAVFIFLVVCMAGCGGYYDNNFKYTRFSRVFSIGSAPVNRVLPESIGLLYGRPDGWNDRSPRCITLKNTTAHFARCWLNGRAIKFVYDYGAPPQMAQAGKKGFSVLAPKQKSRHILQGRSAFVRCEFYAGPEPLVLYSRGEGEIDLENPHFREFPLGLTYPKRVE